MDSLPQIIGCRSPYEETPKGIMPLRVVQFVADEDLSDAEGCDVTLGTAANAVILRGHGDIRIGVLLNAAKVGGVAMVGISFAP